MTGRRHDATSRTHPRKRRYVAPRIVGFGSLVALCLLVEVLIRVGVINRFIVPLPSEIIGSFEPHHRSRSTCSAASC